MSKLVDVIMSLPIKRDGVEIAVKALTEPHRKYHNVDHIERMIELALREGYSVEKDPRMFEAIVFHDVVYYPQSKINEELSALVYRSICLDPSDRYTVMEAIWATIDHTNPANTEYEEVPWILDFLDYDLEGLATNFYENSRKIYYEFRPYVTDEEFFDGRLSFFKKMIASKSIFHNHPEWEEPARKNIQGEIDRMEAMLTIDGAVLEVSGVRTTVNGRVNYLQWLCWGEDD